MLDLKELLIEAEHELTESTILKRAVKLGIICSVVQTTLETYRPGNVEGSSSMLATQLVDLIVRSGAFRDLLYDRLEIETPSPRASVKPDKPQAVSQPIVPSLDGLEEMARKVSQAVGLSPTEQEALLEVIRNKNAESQEEGEVLNRSDEDLADEEIRQVQEELGLAGAGFGLPPSSYGTVDGNSHVASTS